MKVVILAGGSGERFGEDSLYLPKPMIEIDGMPILWHIMKEYSYYGLCEFVICAGYRQETVKNWFAEYCIRTKDVTFDFRSGDNNMFIQQRRCEPWVITVADTGLHTGTGGRIKRIQPYIGDETFMMTYGDGVCDVDIAKLLEFHKCHGKLATMTTVTLKRARDVLEVEKDDTVRAFREKRRAEGTAIDAGYMVLEPKVFDYIEGDGTAFECESLVRLAADGQMMRYRHSGYWRCMGSKQDRDILEELLTRGIAPWKKW